MVDNRAYKKKLTLLACLRLLYVDVKIEAWVWKFVVSPFQGPSWLVCSKTRISKIAMMLKEQYQLDAHSCN